MIDKHHPDITAQLVLGNDNVTPFKPRVVTPKVMQPEAGAVDPEMVKLFEDYLAAAKAGKIKFAAIALVDADGIAYSTWCPEQLGPERVTQALGAVGYLSHRFHASADAGAVIADNFQT